MTQAAIIIVGAGPTGMTAALDLARYGVPSLVLDQDHVLSEGSRAIAYSSATLAMWERLGAVEAMLAKGVAWSVRHTYFRERELYSQNFPLPGEGFLPRFFNLQQYYVERYLLDQIEQNPLVDLHWDHKVTGCQRSADGVRLQVSAPAGEMTLDARYVLACDGPRSSLRKLLNLPFPGVTHQDHFLIADIRVDLQSPPEPRFFFDHATNPGQTILIHPQPDGIWRFDWQVGPEVDIRLEHDPQRMDRRIRALIGDLPYEIVWLSDYRFHQRLLDQFRHGPIFFAGDSAHLMAPFGARGLNSAVADVENLVWKLALVLNHGAPDTLLDTYQTERWPAQLHNQQVTNNTMLFMSPPDRWRRIQRNLILWISAFSKSARKWVNSGKMVEPYRYTGSPIIVEDQPGEAWQGGPPPGEKAPDLRALCLHDGDRQPVFLRSLLGSGFVALYFASSSSDGDRLSPAACPDLPGVPLRVYPVLSGVSGDTGLAGPLLIDEDGSLHAAFDARPGSLYLIRPDGHVAARRRRAGPAELPGLLCCACGVERALPQRSEDAK